MQITYIQVPKEKYSENSSEGNHVPRSVYEYNDNFKISKQFL